jgi:hypothetical protein
MIVHAVKSAVSSRNTPELTPDGLLVAVETLESRCPPLERLDVGAVEVERLVAVLDAELVLGRRVVDVARRAVRVEHGVGLDRHLDGLGVALDSLLKVLLRVQLVAPVLERLAERVALRLAHGLDARSVGHALERVLDGLVGRLGLDLLEQRAVGALAVDKLGRLFALLLLLVLRARRLLTGTGGRRRRRA